MNKAEICFLVIGIYAVCTLSYVLLALTGIGIIIDVIWRIVAPKAALDDDKGYDELIRFENENGALGLLSDQDIALALKNLSKRHLIRLLHGINVHLKNYCDLAVDYESNGELEVGKYENFKRIVKNEIVERYCLES